MDAARQNMPKKRRNQRDYCLFQPDCCPFCLPLPYFCCIIKHLKTMKWILLEKPVSCLYVQQWLQQAWYWYKCTAYLTGVCHTGDDVNVEFYSPPLSGFIRRPVRNLAIKKVWSLSKRPSRLCFFRWKGKNVTAAVLSKWKWTRRWYPFFDSSGHRLLTDKDYEHNSLFQWCRCSIFQCPPGFLLDKDSNLRIGTADGNKVNQRNQKLFLRNQNMSICIPFIHSVKGYALYWDNYSHYFPRQSARESSTR